MKKKFKLFATIGSLALAVCMMTIGVLAAAQVSLTVNSTVSFSAESVYVQVDGELAGGTQEEAQTFSVKNYTGSEVGAVSPGNFVNVTGDTPVSSNTIGFTEVEYSETENTVTYKFTITNKGSVPAFVKVTVTNPTNPSLDYGSGLTKDASSTSAITDFTTGAGSINKDDTLVLKYTLTLTDFSTSVYANNQVSFVFDFDNASLAA